jgi:nitroreductase
MLVVCANLEALAATDRDLDRYQLVGGASIYPFVWNVLLAARERGLGGVMTTVATRNEDALRDALAIPSTYAVACVVALGHPSSHRTKLTRKPVESFATVDTFDGPAYGESSA